MSTRFSAELSYADREFGRIRQVIANADVAELSSALINRERSAATRAHAYVWLAATLERVIGDSLRSTLREITSASVPQAKIRTSLFALMCDPELMSISDRARQFGWPIRVSLFDRLLVTAPAVMSEDILPLDGRTLRAEHFDTLWLVFGLLGPSLPGPIHRVSLKDLANGRNDVAHGHVDPIFFGKAKSTTDLFNLTVRVDEIALHVIVALDNYLTQKGYLR